IIRHEFTGIYRFRDVLNFSVFENMTVYLHDKFNESDLREVVEYCMGIRCTHLLSFSSHVFSHITNIFSNDSLREMMHDKFIVDINLICAGITADGLFVVWEDLLNGKFDGLSLSKLPSLPCSVYLISFEVTERRAHL
ncbi:hypothetical protein PFISCL1PPCAC_21189, partial [Pristionchus fissidentatus]